METIKKIVENILCNFIDENRYTMVKIYYTLGSIHQKQL